MKQPGGIGTAVVWADPADYIETFLGFRRYFTLENRICKALFDLARKPPKKWEDCRSRSSGATRADCRRSRGLCPVRGRLPMQAANMRSAANHEIQSPGAEITKAVQRKLWDLQPAGIHELRIGIMNVHDELMVVATRGIGRYDRRWRAREG